MSALRQLRGDGFQLTVASGRLIVEPASRLTDKLRDLIRENKAAILQELSVAATEAPKMLKYAEDAHQKTVSTFGDDEHLRSSGGALERRRLKVERALAKHPEKRLAFDVAGAPPRPEPGPPVSVVLAVRTSIGVVSGELHIPRDRFNPVQFFQVLEATTGRPA